MDSIKEIYKKVKEKKKQGYEGYGDIKCYFEKFSLDQLNYIENAFKVNQKSTERFLTFSNITPLSVAIIAVMFSVVPDKLKENLTSFYNMLSLIFIFGVVCIMIFYFIQSQSKKITIYETALGIIKEVKEQRNE